MIFNYSRQLLCKWLNIVPTFTRRLLQHDFKHPFRTVRSPEIVDVLSSNNIESVVHSYKTTNLRSSRRNFGRGLIEELYSSPSKRSVRVESSTGRLLLRHVASIESGRYTGRGNNIGKVEVNYSQRGHEQLLGCAQPLEFPCALVRLYVAVDLRRVTRRNVFASRLGNNSSVLNVSFYDYANRV